MYFLQRLPGRPARGTGGMHTTSGWQQPHEGCTDFHMSVLVTWRVPPARKWPGWAQTKGRIPELLLPTDFLLTPSVGGTDGLEGTRPEFLSSLPLTPE